MAAALCVRCLTDGGYSGVTAAGSPVAPHWSAVIVADGTRVRAVWRPQGWGKEVSLARQLHAKFPHLVPRLVGTLECNGGVLVVYEDTGCASLEAVACGEGGAVPYALLLRVCVAVARAVALCHSQRVFLGALCPA